MDVAALYPSITAEMATKAVRESMKISDLKWNNITIKQLIRYVSVCCDRKLIESDDLGNVIPIPKTKTTLNSLTNPSKKTREQHGDNQFNPTVRNPTESEVKKIIGHAVSAGIDVCMKNHYYRINGDIRCQAEGGAIGSELSGEVARNFIINWDKKFLK